MKPIVAAFMSGITVDVLATLVFHYTNKNKPIAAATYNVLVTACVLYVFVDVTRDPIVAIPYLLGIWVGGILGIAVKRRLEAQHDQAGTKTP